MRGLRAAVLTIATLVAASATAGRLSPGLEAQLAGKSTTEPVTVLVVLGESVDVRGLDADLHERHASLALRHRVVVEQLRDAARASQAALLADLAARRDRGEVLRFRAHWLVNGVVVTATPAAVRQIATRTDVDVVETDLVPALIAPVKEDPAAAQKDAAAVGIAPGVVGIGARRVWDELGVRGEGTLIGSLDTGVDIYHPAT